jgi:hypothetical protein
MVKLVLLDVKNAMPVNLERIVPNVKKVGIVVQMMERKHVLRVQLDFIKELKVKHRVCLAFRVLRKIQLEVRPVLNVK